MGQCVLETLLRASTERALYNWHILSLNVSAPQAFHFSDQHFLYRHDFTGLLTHPPQFHHLNPL